MARDTVTKDEDYAAQPGMVILNFMIPVELKELLGDAAWSMRMSRGGVMRAFLAEADFETWLKARKLKIKPTKPTDDAG